MLVVLSDYSESEKSCFTIHSEKPTARIAVPMEAISAMKDIITLLI